MKMKVLKKVRIRSWNLNLGTWVIHNVFVVHHIVGSDRSTRSFFALSVVSCQGESMSQDCQRYRYSDLQLMNTNLNLDTNNESQLSGRLYNTNRHSFVFVFRVQSPQLACWHVDVAVMLPSQRKRLMMLLNWYSSWLMYKVFPKNCTLFGYRPTTK